MAPVGIIASPLLADQNTTVACNATLATLDAVSRTETAHSLALCGWALIRLGSILPFVVWPLLPSTSETNNYRMLTVSAAAQLLLVLAWGTPCWTNAAHCLGKDLLWTMPLWIFPLNLRAIILGIGRAWPRQFGSRCGRGDFDHAAQAAWWALLAQTIVFSGVPILAPLVREHLTTANLELVLWVVYAVVGARVPTRYVDPVASACHSFMTRRVDSFHWLPQNGAEVEFEPWWSYLLLFAPLLPLSVQTMALLQAMKLGSDCRQ